MEVITGERELQKTEVYADAAALEQGKALGANYLILGEAYTFRTWYHQQKATLEPPTGYYTNLRVGLKMVNVATGKVESHKVIGVIQNRDGVTDKGYADPSRSQADALSALHIQVNRWMLQVFPLELNIMEVSEASKKGEAERVRIDGGSAYGLHMAVTTSTVRAIGGTPLEVFEITQEEVDGKMMERTVEIGEIVLKKVESDLISECKVRSGGDAIQKNIQAGKKMVCRIKSAVILD